MKPRNWRPFRRARVALAILVGLGGCIAAAVASLREPARQGLYVWINDTSRSLGLGVRQRDLDHLRRRTGLTDVSAVRCRDCHGMSTNDLAWARPRPRRPSPRGLAISPDGKRLFVATPDVDQVVEVDALTRRILRRIPIAGRPSGMAVDPAGRRLYVTCREADLLVAVDLDDPAAVTQVSTGLDPVGVAFAVTPRGPRLVVANAGSDDLSVIDAGSMREIARLVSGREPYGVACSADGTRAWVACRLARISSQDAAPWAELTVIDLERARVLARQPLESAHLSESVAVAGTRSWILTPLVRVRNLVPITQVARGWVMSGGLAISDPDGTRVIQIPTDDANAYYADPAGVAVDAEGRRAYLASGGADVVTVIALEGLADWLDGASATTIAGAIHDLELSARYVRARIPTGRNPGSMVLSPDGSTLFVAERLRDSILAIDTRTLRPAGRIELGDDGGADPTRRGEAIFTTASRTFQGQFSCRSCHPEGHVDGLTYDFDGDGIGDNRLDNRSLRGLAGTWPFKWNGKNPNLEVQCGPRFAKVLMRTDPFAPSELEDLRAFLESMPPARTVHASRRNRPLTPAQERGRAVFFASQTPDGRRIPEDRQCATCHRPPLYTNRQKTDVGTRGRFDTGGEFDTPHLLGIAASAPYLHDGRAKTLEELWTIYQTNDLHGVSSYMNKHQLNDLIEFLKIL